MAGVRLVKRDVRPSHDVTSDRHANLAHPAARISQYDKKNTVLKYGAIFYDMLSQICSQSSWCGESSFDFCSRNTYHSSL